MSNDTGDAGPTPQTQRIEELAEQIRKLEAKTELELIRREARLIPAVIGVIKYVRLRTIATDEKGQAALHAILSRIFSPGSAAAAGGLLVLFFTAVQAGLVWRQNLKLDQQTQLMQAQVNTALTAPLGALLQDISEQAKTFPCLKKETIALAGLVDDRMPSCWANVPLVERSRWVHCYYMERPGTRVRIRSDQGSFKSVMSRLGDRGSFMSVKYKLQQFTEVCTDIEDPPSALVASRVPLDDSVAARVATLTRLARSYRFIETEEGKPAVSHTPKPYSSRFADWLFSSDDSPRLINHPLSPERGILLAHLLTNGFDVGDAESLASADWSQSYAPAIQGRGASLPYIKGAYLQHADLSGASLAGFEKTDLRCADLTSADLSGGLFFDVDLGGVDLGYAKLPRRGFRPTNLEEANFHGAIVSDRDFIDTVTGVRGFDRSHWTLEEIPHIESAQGRAETSKDNSTQYRILRVGTEDDSQVDATQRMILCDT